MFFLAVSMLWGSAMYAQQPPITIKWTAEFNCNGWYPLDSVVIYNSANRSGYEQKMTVYYPDTVFVFYDNTKIKPIELEQKTSLKTYPNPFSNHTQVEFSLARYGETDLTVYDMLGREIIRQSFVLERGTHSFTVSLPQGIYTLNLQTGEDKSSARLISEGKAVPQIVYNGTVPNTENTPQRVYKADNTDFPCEYGDMLIFQGFITENDVVYVEKHALVLTEDAFISFAFFNANVLDTFFSVANFLVAKGYLSRLEGIPENLIISFSDLTIKINLSSDSS